MTGRPAGEGRRAPIEGAERDSILCHCLAANLRARPDHTALTVSRGEGDEKRWSFGGFFDAATRLAGGLREQGVARAERVVLRLEDSSDFALAFFASLAAGLVPVPTSAQLTERELRWIVGDAEARLLITSDALAPEGALPGDVRILASEAFGKLKAYAGAPFLAETRAEDPAFLIYTSGTTERPKGVLHAQRNAWGRRPMIEGWTGLQAGDVMLHAGRLNWTYTLGVGLMDPWSVGASAVLYDGPREPALWPALIEKHRATIFTAVPTLYRQILKYCDISRFDLSSLRHGLTAGEPLSPQLLAAWRAATGKELYESLGMSEVSTYISSGPSTPIVAGSPGRAQPGRRVAILPVEGGAHPLPPGEVGLLAVHRSDPGLMLGYWHRPEEEAACYRGDWFVGGDLASIDENGYVWFHGRNDDVMKALGYRVSPFEVEQVLAEHPGIAEAAVTELEIRPDLSVIAAFIVPKQAGSIGAEEVLSWCEGRLADYKRPKEIRFLAELPRMANGKLLRRRLAAASAGG